MQSIRANVNIIYFSEDEVEKETPKEEAKTEDDHKKPEKMETSGTFTKTTYP